MNKKINNHQSIERWIDNSLSVIKYEREKLESRYAAFLKNLQTSKFRKSRIKGLRGLKEKFYNFSHHTVIPNIIQYDGKKRRIIMGEIVTPINMLTSQKEYIMGNYITPMIHYNVYHIIPNNNDKQNPITYDDMIKLLNEIENYLLTFKRNLNKPFIPYSIKEENFFYEEKTEENEIEKVKKPVTKQKKIEHKVGPTRSYMSLAHIYAKMSRYKAQKNPRYRLLYSEEEKVRKDLENYISDYIDLKYKKKSPKEKAISKEYKQYYAYMYGKYYKN